MIATILATSTAVLVGLAGAYALNRHLNNRNAAEEDDTATDAVSAWSRVNQVKDAIPARGRALIASLCGLVTAVLSGVISWLQ